MLLSFSVIVDAHQNHFPEISLERVPIILTLNLVDSRIGILIVFQFEYNSRQVNVSVGYHYDICEAFASRQFPYYLITASGSIKCQRQDASQ